MLRLTSTYSLLGPRRAQHGAVIVFAQNAVLHFALQFLGAETARSEGTDCGYIDQRSCYLMRFMESDCGIEATSFLKASTQAESVP